jgi:hypothetical protein
VKNSKLGKWDLDKELPSCLCTYDREVERPVSKIPIDGNEWFAICMLGNSVGPGAAHAFVAEAIREKLARKIAGLSESRRREVLAALGESGQKIKAMSLALETVADKEAMYEAIGQLEAPIGKSEVLVNALIDCLGRWAESEYSEEEMNRNVLTFMHMGSELDEQFRSAYERLGDACRAVDHNAPTALAELKATA